jgi:uncharacterized membrane protein YhaH (DUF805 family)
VFWLALLANNLICTLILVSVFLGFGGVADASAPFPSLTDALALFDVIVVSLSLWVDAAVSAKRWHDRGKTGWMVLVFLIPVVGLVWSLVELGSLPGTSGANRHGDEPSRIRT